MMNERVFIMLRGLMVVILILIFAIDPVYADENLCSTILELNNVDEYVSLDDRYLLYDSILEKYDIQRIDESLLEGFIFRSVIEDYSLSLSINGIDETSRLSKYIDSALEYIEKYSYPTYVSELISEIEKEEYAGAAKAYLYTQLVKLCNTDDEETIFSFLKIAYDEYRTNASKFKVIQQLRQYQYRNDYLNDLYYNISLFEPNETFYWMKSKLIELNNYCIDNDIEDEYATEILIMLIEEQLKEAAFLYKENESDAMQPKLSETLLIISNDICLIDEDTIESLFFRACIEYIKANNNADNAIYFNQLYNEYTSKQFTNILEQVIHTRYDQAFKSMYWDLNAE